MSKTLKTYLFLFAVLIAIMVVIDQMRQKPPDWSPTYQLNGKKPLDLYVLNQEINHLFNDSVFRYDRSPYEYFMEKDSSDARPENYLIINDLVYIDDALARKILDAVHRGSTLFVVSDGFTASLIDTLGISCDYAPSGNPVAVNDYTIDSLEKKFQVSNDDRPRVKLKFSKEAWSGKTYTYSPVFGQYAFVQIDTVTTTALGYMMFPNGSEYINFMEIKFGKGKIILHNQPVVFSNYSLLSHEPLQEYAERVLSYLPDQRLVWFVHSQLGTGEEKKKNQLSVILEYPALRMTWLVFIYGLLLFVVFSAKRKQRVVPIIKPLRNTTVEFAQTIGNLYFQEGDIGDVARKKIIYFLDRVRRTYNIDTQLPDKELVSRLQLKSGKDAKLVEDIVSLIREIEKKNQCDKQSLIKLSACMERFWDNVSSHAK